MEADIAEVKDRIKAHENSLSQCTDSEERKLIMKILCELEISRQGLHNLLTVLIQRKFSEPGIRQLLFSIKS